MATAKKTSEPLDPDGVAVADDQGPEAGRPTLAELGSDPGGMFVNTGLVDLVLLQPATVLKPGHMVELEYDPRHRDLHRATPEQMRASREAEAAEQAAAEAESSATTPAEEQ